MRSRLFTALTALFAVLLEISCVGPKHESSAHVILGPVALTNCTPSELIYLGSGENLVITPTMLSHGQLQLDVAYDRREVTGEETHLAQRTVQTRPDRVTEVSFGVVTFTLTPRMKQ